MKSNKKIIIIISIILIIAIVATVFAYLFMATDIFKSNKELFAKYFSQNQETIQKITDLQVSETYKNLGNENKYESNSTIKILCSEGGEISDPINNLSAILNVQKDNEAQYVYANAQVLYENESYFDAEVIKQQEQYGIKIPDVAKKFVSIENDENIEEIANDIGLDVEQLKLLIGVLNGTTQEKLEENKDILKKYSNIIKNGVLEGKFEKQKNALITYNNVSTKTNAYTVSLNEEQVKNILVEIMNNIKSDTTQLNKEAVNNSNARTITPEEMSNPMPTDDIVNMSEDIISNISEKLKVPSIKVIVYEQNQKTIRTIFEIGEYKIVVEDTAINGAPQIIISGLKAQEELLKIKIDKMITGNKEELKTTINVDGEENVITLLNNIQSMNDETTINTEISYEKGITRNSLKIENKINTSEFEKIELVERNNVVLNNLNKTVRKNFVNALKQKTSEKMDENFRILEQKIKQTNEVPSEDEIPQVEINKFNAKFEFYTGDEVAAENVKVLLGIVKENIGNYQISNIGTNEDEENTEEAKSNIKIYIEKDKTNEDGMTKILEKIEDNKKYKVLISYKQSNGLIDYITITEI